MKNLIKIFFISLVAVFFTACTEEEEIVNTLQNEGYVYFSSSNPSSISESEVVNTSADGTNVRSSRFATFEILRSGNDNSSALEVGVDVNAVYATTTDFFNAGDDASDNIIVSFNETVTIPAGKNSGTFSISAVDDIISAGEIDVTFSISSVSDASYSIGFPAGEAPERTSINFSIEEDDCPVIFDNLLGTFEVVETSLNGGATDEYEVEITQNPNNIFQLSIEGIFGIEEGAVLVVDLQTCSKSFSWDQNSPFYTGDTRGGYFLERRDIQFAANPEPQFLGAGLDLDPDVVSDWSEYDDEAGTITLYGRVRLGDLGFFGGFTFEMTKVAE